MTKEEWQGAKKHHLETPRCGVCGAPIAKTRARVRGMSHAIPANPNPLCIACGLGFQELKARLEAERLDGSR